MYQFIGITSSRPHQLIMDDGWLLTPQIAVLIYPPVWIQWWEARRRRRGCVWACDGSMCAYARSGSRRLSTFCVTNAPGFLHRWFRWTSVTTARCIIIIPATCLCTIPCTHTIQIIQSYVINAFLVQVPMKKQVAIKIHCCIDDVTVVQSDHFSVFMIHQANTPKFNSCSLLPGMVFISVTMNRSLYIDTFLLP